ncbi:MAG: pilus assembly protein N-terminal domain-containing protein [Phenylobacterium sp.]|uniref:pilus assembly protein N-terminal domain-containing protein n=1 Tax=Phenylobacterium sp. TaxID=1871053 RepID=UPI002718EB54|nr:pilus assembly protein N-terminal domain-containing protein [Phenylobacterium sp.]MDO8902859.1 pilus assembly protein N-terminal domain-containing protein [Phenylobacterium sp.]MDP2215389.1 pilus assembly protein N-terminal domain-containing protein [Phenylobacterium sp.]
MRRLAVCAILSLMVATPAAASSLSVRLDQGAKVRLPGAARNVVVANPRIADVSLLGPQDLVVVGKGYGITNVVVTDAAGRVLFDRDVVVSAPEYGQMSYIRGGQSRTFSCSPRCEQIGQSDAPRAIP